ncbi:MAG: imidazole glycerol phosphate synthase subunit HisH [Myxococcales bacterium FL481]|nr:MAG: imidazole glycerol phosphate synthase subunit HisH [Myxococcales bacterium FL481]
MAMQVQIVPTGVANLASVQAGLRRVGASSTIGADPDAARRADRVVLPGVGAFAPAIEQLRQSGLAQALQERVEQGRPTLCVCLGLHLLCRSSEESPGASGLGIVPADVRRFDPQLRVPQFGWNKIVAPDAARYLQSGYAYFANSFRLSEPVASWACTMSDYGGPFVAALERGDVVACQFHPELSGAFGAGVLRRFVGGPHAC